MLHKLSQTLQKFAFGWLVLVFLAGEVLFNAVLLPRQQAKMIANSGTGPIDLQFFYTPETVYGMIDAYGEAGRADYRLFEMTSDIIYPIVYTLFFSLLLTWLLQRGFAPGHRIQAFNVVPFWCWY